MTTTDGTRGFSRQQVYGEKGVNFLVIFCLLEYPGFHSEGKTREGGMFTSEMANKTVENVDFGPFSPGPVACQWVCIENIGTTIPRRRFSVGKGSFRPSHKKHDTCFFGLK